MRNVFYYLFKKKEKKPVMNVNIERQYPMMKKSKGA